MKSFFRLKQDIQAIANDYQDMRDRLVFMADICARCVPGDLIEIGAGRGGMTTQLAAVARKYGRRVVAVDPWEVGVEGCQEGDREIFYHSILPYWDIVEVEERSSLTVSMAQNMQTRPLCFAYVDGLRTYPAMLADLVTVSHAAVIAVRIESLEFVINLAANLTRKMVIRPDGKEEAYLL